MTLDNLIGKGLQREPADAQEIGRFLTRIATKLLDALIQSVTDIKAGLEHWLATERPELLDGSR